MCPTPPRTPKSRSDAPSDCAAKNSASPQQDLGLEVGYDQGWVSHIENGRTNPAYGTVDRIARALAWPMSRLVALAESIETEDRRPLDRPLRPQQRPKR
jgi:transcriptional regulator with XRE-family HTH domain